MGYRVGYQCFSTKEAAYDYLLSQQLPTISADGTLLRPVKQGENWYFQGQIVQLSLPECDIQEQIEMGILMASPFLLLATIVFGFKVIMKLIERMTSVGGESHD